MFKHFKHIFFKHVYIYIFLGGGGGVGWVEGVIRNSHNIKVQISVTV